MNIRQENAVGTEMDDIPTLVEHGGKIVANKEMVVHPDVCKYC